MIQKTEKYTMRQAAEDRVKELQNNGIRASFYRGENTYIVKYWVEA